MMTMTAIEKQNKRKGMRNSLIIHALLLLIVFFYAFPKGKDLNAVPPPVVVDFSYEPSSLSKYARAEEGKKKPKTEKVVPIKQTKVQPIPTPKVKTPPVVKPTKPDPEPTDPIVTDAIQEEAPIEAVDEEVVVEEPEQEVLTPEDLEELEQEEEELAEEPEEVVMPTTKTTTAEESSESAEDSAVTNGDEGGTGKGNEGTGPGKSGGDDGDEGEGDAGNGTGVYDDSGDGVFGRKVTYRNTKELLRNMNNTNGVIVMKFCVNRQGEVTFVEINELETTETNRAKLKQVAKAMYGYKVEPDPSAPAEQCGKYKFKLDINAFGG